MSEIKPIRPDAIFLEPECCACPETGAQWCQDDVFDQCEDGVRATRYVRGDIHDDVAARLRAAEAERDAMREAGYRALNYIENTESELGIKLGCGDALRAALGQVPTP